MGRSPQLQGALGLTVLALALPASATASIGFTHGVTAGEITSSSAIVWGQTTKDAKVKAEVATDTRFHHVAVARSLTAKRSNDDTVQKKVGGLKAGTTYHYRFCIAKKCSDAGKFQTAPKASQSKTIRFAYSGDESAQAAAGQHHPFWGQFTAFKSMAAEHNNFNMDFGDTIYSDPEVPNIATALTVKQKWAMYRKKLSVKNQRTIRESAGLYNHWDDHEFVNDFTKAENGAPLYKAGVKAFRTYEPVTYSKKNGIYRTFRWGKNLQVFFLDLRSFRSAKASAGGVCDNPDTPGAPDLAPTAPTATRNFFSVLAPSLSQPVSPACLAAINDPGRTMLGSRQYNRFLADVTSSTAKWKVVMTEDPIQQFYALPYDRWEGYAHERVKLLKDLQAANVDHLAFLTTDTHAALQNVVRYRTLAGDSAPANAPTGTFPIDTPYQDFVIGPVATKPFWQEIDDTTGTAGSGMGVSGAFFKPPPASGGLGMSCAQGGVNSYAEVTVTAGKLTVAYKDENGNTLMDSDGTTPCGPYHLTG